MNHRNALGLGSTALLALLLGTSFGSAQAQSGVTLHSTAPTVGPVVLGGGNCAGGEIYDDGTAENGYSGSPATISSFEGVQRFTPTSYPATYDTACVGLVSLAGPDLDFEIEVRADDGPGGEPGTLLGTVPVSAAGIPGGLPCTFYSYDISSLGLNIASGSVYIGVRWNPMTFPSRFVCADETPATPLHPGFINFNNPSQWQTTQTVFPSYRAKLIRAVPGTVGPTDADLALTKTTNAAPGIQPGTNFDYTLTASNNGPADATGVTVVDTLPALVTYVSNTCGAGVAGNVLTWNIGGLVAGANAVCVVTVTLDDFGLVVNSATISGDQDDLVSGNDTASAGFESVVATPPIQLPTLGQWGLILLGGIMLLLAVRRLTAGRR